MTETPEELERAAVLERGKMDSYMQFMVALTKGVQIDEKTKTIIFGLLIGTMNSEVARKSSRPWMYLVGLLTLAFVGYVVWSVWVITTQQWNFFLWMTGGLTLSIS
jgi:hypothetical protein